MHSIGRLYRAVAGIAGAPVGIDDLENYAVGVVLNDRPVALGDIVLAAVQVRDAFFVELELVLLAIQREAATADAVGAAAGRSAEIGGVEGIIGKIVEAEQKLGPVAVKAQILDDRPPGHDVGSQAATDDLDAIDGIPIRRRPKNFPLQSAFRHINSSIAFEYARSDPASIRAVPQPVRWRKLGASRGEARSD